jgi:hypothetical protein
MTSQSSAPSNPKSAAAQRSRSALSAGVLIGAAASLAGLTIALVPGPSPAFAAPEPDPVPRRWQFTIEPGPMRVATVDVEGVGPQNYLYMTYKVVNSSGQDLIFAPSFDLATHDGKVMRGGRGVPAAATRQILERLENPFLEDQIGIVGMLLQGEDNAKEGLVVWNLPAQHLSSVDVFASGFSGELRTIEVKDAATGNPKRVSLRKTMMLRFQPPGEIQGERVQEFPLVEQRWVMR